MTNFYHFYTLFEVEKYSIRIFDYERQWIPDIYASFSKKDQRDLASPSRWQTILCFSSVYTIQRFLAWIFRGLRVYRLESHSSRLARFPSLVVIVVVVTVTVGGALV